jgi:TldD protein
MLSVAKTAASLVDEKVSASVQKITPAKIPNYYPIKAQTLSIPVSSKIPIIQNLNDECYNLSDKVVKVQAYFNDDIKRIMVVTSDGVKGEDIMPKSALAANVTLEKGDRRESSGWNLGGRRDFSYYQPEIIDEIAHEAVSRGLELFEAKKPPAGEMPVVLGPGVTGILLHEAIGHGMEADFNRKNMARKWPNHLSPSLMKAP